MLRFIDSTSPVKALPGLISATSTHIVVQAQSVRWFDAVYNVPAVTVPVAWNSAPARYRVVLTAARIVRDEQFADFAAPIAGEVCELASLALGAPSDTPLTVTVDVPRRTATTPTPANAVVHTVPATVITQTETTERAKSRSRAARLRTLASNLSGKQAAVLTAADRNDIIERLALREGMDP